MNKLEAQRVFKEWLPELELAARYNTSRQSYERYAAVEAILEPEGGTCDEVIIENSKETGKLLRFKFSDGTFKLVSRAKLPALLRYSTVAALRDLRAKVLELTESSTPELVRNTDVLALIDEMLGSDEP